MKRITAPLSFLGAYLFLSVALAQETTPNLDTWHSWHTHSHGFWWIFPLLMLAFFFFCMQRGRHWRWAPPWWSGRYPDRWQKFDRDEETNSQSALAILDRRFARGEIPIIEGMIQRSLRNCDRPEWIRSGRSDRF
jgi:hypothetical protein